MDLVVDLPKLKEALARDKPWLSLLIPIFGPTYAFGWLIATLLQSQGKITKDDAQNVEEIIKAGAEANVDEMTIVVDRDNSLGLDMKLKQLKTSRSFLFNIGMKGETHYEIKVKYKNDVSPLL